jgi:ribosomal protein L12E/L44/L45/RPP1/RPP2
MKSMKKIMSLMLGLSLLMGAVTIASAQDAPKKEQGKKKSKKKKKEENK